MLAPLLRSHHERGCDCLCLIAYWQDGDMHGTKHTHLQPDCYSSHNVQPVSTFCGTAVCTSLYPSCNKMSTSCSCQPMPCLTACNLHTHPQNVHTRYSVTNRADCKQHGRITCSICCATGPLHQLPDRAATCFELSCGRLRCLCGSHQHPV